MDNIADVFLQVYTQMRILHWQTKSYARHMAFGAFYEFLDNTMDKIIEEEMGKYGRVRTAGTIKIKNMDECNLDAFLKEFEMFLVAFDKHYNAPDDKDLLNLRDGVLGEVKKLRYLLTLE